MSSSKLLKIIKEYKVQQQKKTIKNNSNRKQRKLSSKWNNLITLEFINVNEMRWDGIIYRSVRLWFSWIKHLKQQTWTWISRSFERLMGFFTLDSPTLTSNNQQLPYMGSSRIKETGKAPIWWSKRIHQSPQDETENETYNWNSIGIPKCIIPPLISKIH